MLYFRSSQGISSSNYLSSKVSSNENSSGTNAYEMEGPWFPQKSEHRQSTKKRGRVTLRDLQKHVQNGRRSFSHTKSTRRMLREIQNTRGSIINRSTKNKSDTYSAFSASPQWTRQALTQEVSSSKQNSVSQSLFQPKTQTHLQPVTDSAASDSLATLEEMVLESVRDTPGPVHACSDDKSVTDSAIYGFCGTIDDASMSTTVDNYNDVDGIQATKGNPILRSSDGPLYHEAPKHSYQQQYSTTGIHPSPHPRGHGHAVLEEVVLESMPSASDQHGHSHHPPPDIYMTSLDTCRVKSKPINTARYNLSNNVIEVEEDSFSETVDAPQHLGVVPTIAFGLNQAPYEHMPPLPRFAAQQYEHQTQTATEPSTLLYTPSPDIRYREAGARGPDLRPHVQPQRPRGCPRPTKESAHMNGIHSTSRNVQLYDGYGGYGVRSLQRLVEGRGAQIQLIDP